MKKIIAIEMYWHARIFLGYQEHASSRTVLNGLKVNTKKRKREKDVIPVPRQKEDFKKKNCISFRDMGLQPNDLKPLFEQKDWKPSLEKLIGAYEGIREFCIFGQDLISLVNDPQFRQKKTLLCGSDGEQLSKMGFKEYIIVELLKHPNWKNMAAQVVRDFYSERRRTGISHVDFLKSIGVPFNF